jgi:ribosomal protein S18 acetylase RimI-like enzyme
VADVIIRSYRPQDEAAVQEITYRTGFKGKDLTDRDYFDDERLFFMIFIYYYTCYEPEHFFVAVNTGTGAVVGFIGGTTDTVTQERAFLRKMIWRIAARAVLFTSWRYPQTFKTLTGMSKMAGDFGRNRETIAAIHAAYPAHLHINLLPEYQGMGLGTRLMKRFEAHLVDQGVTGVHLQTSSHNQKAIPFYKKLGFAVVSQVQVTSHPTLNDLEFLTFAKTLGVPRKTAGE